MEGFFKGAVTIKLIRNIGQGAVFLSLGHVAEFPLRLALELISECLIILECCFDLLAQLIVEEIVADWHLTLQGLKWLLHECLKFFNHRLLLCLICISNKPN